MNFDRSSTVADGGSLVTNRDLSPMSGCSDYGTVFVPITGLRFLL